MLVHMRAQEVSERDVVGMIAVVMSKPVIQLRKDCPGTILGGSRLALERVKGLENGVFPMVCDLKAHFIKNWTILWRCPGLRNIFKT